jgi:hypothetical protein
MKIDSVQYQLSRIIAYVFFAVIIYSCSNNVSKTQVKEDAKDSIPHFYWSLDLDTVKEEIPISMYNKSYVLKTKKYSLNDSANHRTVSIDKVDGNEGEMQDAIDVSHNYVVHLNLEYKGKTVVEKLITKDFFKDSLDLDFYNESTIFYSEYKLVRSNRMYFNLVLIKPDTDWAVELKYALFFQTNKKGQVDYWGVKPRE